MALSLFLPYEIEWVIAVNKSTIKIIDFNECKTRRMKKKGLGGTRFLVTTKDNITYVVKPDNLNQTLNEVMVQILIKSLGLTSIDYAFVKIGEIYYGALLYIDGLVRLSNKNFHMLNKNQKIEFLKHLFLNSYLVNSDIVGEIYLTKEESIISLDYGEAGVDIPLFNIDKRTIGEKNVLMFTFLKKTKPDYISRYVLNYIRMVKDYFLDESITIDDLKEVISFVVDRIADFDYSEYESFLKLLLSLLSETHAYIYQEHMNGLKETAKEIKKNFKNIFKDLPAE